MFINLSTHYKKQRGFIDSEFKDTCYQNFKLVEELGELTAVVIRASLEFSKNNEDNVFGDYYVKEEIADVFNMLGSYCLRHNISFDEIHDIIDLKNVRTLSISEEKK